MGHHRWLEARGKRGGARGPPGHTEADAPLGSYRKELFHTPLSEEELGILEEERPEVVIVGAGFKGMLTLTPRAREILAPYDTKVVTISAAMDLVNKEARRFVAFLHLTC